MIDKKQLTVENREILPLFPTCVWKSQLKPEDAERVNNKIKKKLDELTAGKPRLSPGEKWQTEQRLHHLEEFEELTALIHGTIKGVLDFLQVVYDSFEITGCWANINATGARHKAHGHPNNYLSGVYYIQTHKGADTITFDDPRPQNYIMLPHFKKYTAENSRSVTLDVRDGTLLVFPAWFLHSVDRNGSNKERISVSFNIMFPSYTETMSAPKWKGNIEVDQKKA
jgi:uncharacterized protein (TIGR02466 family)